ncbi:hypothetical protein [Natrononativus amylolyticus]|uniref:hypothetical protein n=1 Tax=Natrononativus amylolyticus TaxID=2963434 RepID=UPI0020CFB3A1|nr:hypothetical protein [Natrononativus amylolyticus]
MPYDPTDRGEASKSFDHHDERHTRFVGSMQSGKPLYFDEDTRSFFEGEYDDETNTVFDTAETERELSPRESVGDALESLGDSLEMESLSEFAREHVKDEASEESDVQD